MKIDLFHAGDGDCLLLSAEDAGGVTRVLVDGGRSTQFQEHARSFLYDFPELDVVCVSHIDEDHIAGVLRMLEDEVAWRVFDFRRELFAAGDGPEPRPPSFPRPPKIMEIWHNALFELVGEELEVEVQGTLTATAGLLAGSPDARLRDRAAELDDLATGERSALELSRRISSHQLGIPRNRPLDTLMVRGEGADDVEVGPLTLRVLGPSRDDVERLRARWAKWIAEHGDVIERLRAAMRREEERLGNLSSSTVANPMLESALGEGLSSVSEPNLASLMLLVEGEERSMLLTGDGVSGEILEGLAHHGKLDSDGKIHVDVLKVQHHGALANVTEEFVQRVTADHYLFCGNGAHHNPELEVVEKLALARLAGIGGAGPVGPDRPFTFRFSSSPETPELSDSRRDHLTRVRARVEEIRAAHDPQGRLTFAMLDRGHLELQL